ncbi:serine/threonine-protein phosphatase-like protein 2A activator 1 [Aaosphaeria arxii CBS 175.79]|uniref:Serine/threonine-protein phosphatase 2A activator n=1 Tax=Aaosphaeria arxii CBS 175.79 TaxID=1450172 RepID=A0A6A5X9X3_9PLEO|nr:serine/threonine-protein phosphatase-like protein 2A activator 1 [Aaosphaeria arxii CBS 175.79]KAF2009554.1 serine/threonine-protein phosphatase-like protein 2A activator 1 [Aaosphaeria arxii CBS 175.79]
MATSSATRQTLEILTSKHDHQFAVPVKRINDGQDVDFFLASKAYSDIMTFIFQLNVAMMPRKEPAQSENKESFKEWQLGDPATSFPPVVQRLAELLQKLSAIIDEVPPEKGPRRFGNISFRKWYDVVASRISDLIEEFLPEEILAADSHSEVSAKKELEAYLMGGFGSAQRLDYGTGHELSFLAFLACLWKLGVFAESNDGDQERAIVLGLIEPYLQLIRRLILTYTLEPAGSHGVWGLDDHSFLPYIFGSAQFSPAITSVSDIVVEGSLPSAPNPGDVAKLNAVQRQRQRNMYFSAIGFIYDVKKGPFWEHSPILFDVSGVQAGWAKINKGMLKMYHGEVLSKFPVVQHFPFGSLFLWEKDPAAAEVTKTIHTSSQPSRTAAPHATVQPSLRDPMAEPGTQTTRAPWAGGQNPPPPGATGAPWTSSRSAPRATTGVSVPSGPNQPTRAPWAASTRAPPPPGGTTAAPWARPSGTASVPGAAAATPAPWAEKKP